MDCLAQTGADSASLLIVVLLAVAAIAVGLIIAKRGRTAGIGTLSILALGLVAALSLAPVPQAQASSNECQTPGSSAAAGPAVSGTASASASASQSFTPATGVPSGSDPATPTDSASTAPAKTTEPVTPAGPTCTPGQSKTFNAPAADLVRARYRTAGPGQVVYFVQQDYRGDAAKKIIGELGVSVGSERKITFANATGDPRINPAPQGFTFMDVTGSSEGPEQLSLMISYSKTVTDSASVEKLLATPLHGVKAGWSVPIKGSGVDCEQRPVDDAYVSQQCTNLADITINTDGERSTLEGGPSSYRSILSTYARVPGSTTPGAETRLTGGSVLGMVAPTRYELLKQVLGVRVPTKTDSVDLLQGTKQTAGRYSLGTPRFFTESREVKLPSYLTPRLHVIDAANGSKGGAVGVTWTTELGADDPTSDSTFAEIRDVFVEGGNNARTHPATLIIPVAITDECGTKRSIEITFEGLGGRLDSDDTSGYFSVQIER